MHDAPGVNCGCGQEDYRDGENGGNEENLKNHEICPRCGTALEWRLRLDGVTKLECPECGY